MGNSCNSCYSTHSDPLETTGCYKQQQENVNLASELSNGVAESDVSALICEAKQVLSHITTANGTGIDTKMATDLPNLVSRLEVAVKKLESIGGQSPAAVPPPPPTRGVPAAPTSNNPFVVAYDELLSTAVKAFLDCCQRIGGDVAQISQLVNQAFQTQKQFLIMASQSKQPSDADLPKVLEPLGQKIQDVINFRESHRTSPFFNHLSAISESIPGLSWVAVAPAPGPYVKEMGDAAMFYSNRVLKDFREKDKNHVDWVQNWSSVFRELQAYIKQYHTTGVTWNAQGGAASAPAGGVPPPPPPGIPPPPPIMDMPAAAAPDDGRAALFNQINQGTAITSGLKKVTSDMQTHKNPNLRESGPRPFVKTDSSSSRGPSGPVEKPPKFGLEGKKWFIEYQKNQPSLIVDKCSMDHSVYIYRCENTVVQVKGKVNQVIMDSCKKSSVVFDTLVSACEIVNCQSAQMQVMDFVPTITIEKTDGCQVYLSKASLGVEIVTAKSSEMNILIPKGDGDFAECPVPEQFKTTIQGLKLNTVIAEKAGN